MDKSGDDDFTQTSALPSRNGQGITTGPSGTDQSGRLTLWVAIGEQRQVRMWLTGDEHKRLVTASPRLIVLPD